MSDDLIKRLASWGTAAGLGTHFLGTKSAREDCAESAAALSEARAEVERLREALNRIVGRDSHIDASIRSSGPDRVVEYGDFARIARAALEAKHG